MRVARARQLLVCSIAQGRHVELSYRSLSDLVGIKKRCVQRGNERAATVEKIIVDMLFNTLQALAGSNIIALALFCYLCSLEVML